MSSGNSQLIEKIQKEIRSQGALPFARYMEMALYDPIGGYYTAPESASDRVGWHGDFYTSSDVHPVFARAIARQLSQIDRLLELPTRLTLVEMGPGKGIFARDLLRSIQEMDPSLAERLHYVLVERSPALRTCQQNTLAGEVGSAEGIRWVNSLNEPDTDSCVGMMFSNELVDALPVHRVTVEQGELKEIYVDAGDSHFFERLGPPSTPRIREYLDRLGAALAEGQVAEISLAGQAWIREVARVLHRGVVLTIDYGHTAQDLFDRTRIKGTLLCYYQHRACEDPYVRVGVQDLTAHVDFTSLALEGQQAGLQVTGFTNQLSFLSGLRIEDDLEHEAPESHAFHAIVRLLRPQGMGQTFKVLIQHKGLSQPQLDGLRFKPFFESALVAGCASSSSSTSGSVSG